MAPLHYLNVICGTGNYTEQQKTSGVFLFLVQTKYFCWNSEKNGKGLAGEFCSYIMFYPSFKSRQLRSMLQTISMNQHHCFLTSIKLDTSNVFTRIITKVLLWCITKLFSVTFFPCRLKFCFATEITLKIGCLCNTWKKFRTKQKNRKGYVQPYKKMKKVLCFAIVSLQ